MCEMERSFHQTVSMTDWTKSRQEKALGIEARRETGVCPPSGWIGSTEAIRIRGYCFRCCLCEDIEVKDPLEGPFICP